MKTLGTIKTKLEAVKSKKEVSAKAEPKVSTKDKKILLAAEKSRISTTELDLDLDTAAYGDLDAILHEIETSIGLSQVDISANKVTTSTGLLSLDLMTSGGLVSGGWYTFFGGEQSCKSTLASTQMANAITTKIPYLLYFDYEGCVTKDTKIRVGGNYVTFESLIPDDLLNDPPEAKCVINVDLSADTVGQDSVAAILYYGGYQTITQVTTECGSELKGHNHPVLVINAEGGADWKKIEELQIGDVVLVDNN